MYVEGGSRVESSSPVVNEVTITAFREQSGQLFTEAVQHHRPQLIRRGGDRGLLVALDDAWALVADQSFAPQVMRGENGVSIWLEEFDIFGDGSTFARAKADLLGEVRVYVQEYLANADEYRRAPNREAHFAHVVKALIADARGQLDQVVFPAPPDLATLRAEAAATA